MKAGSGTRRILILTADVGLGHRSAAEAIEAALRTSAPSDWSVTVVNPLDDDRVPAILRERQEAYDRLVQSDPDLYKLGYRVADTEAVGALVNGATTVVLYKVLRDIVRQSKPDVIVSTFAIYQAGLGAVMQVTGVPIPILTVVTDLATVSQVWFNSASDLTLVPTEIVRDLAVEHGIPTSRVRVTGLPVDPRLAEDPGDRGTLRVSLGWERDLTTLLVVGSKRVRRLPEMLHGINHAGHPLQLILVAGDDEMLHQKLQETTWHLPARIYGFVEQLPTFMHAADAVMSKAGGLIVTESLAAGLPLLLVDVLPGQEVGNADLVVETGAGELVSDPLSALETVAHWLEADGTLLAERSANARDLGRPRAAHAVAELAVQAAQGELELDLPERGESESDLLRFLQKQGVL